MNIEKWMEDAAREINNEMGIIAEDLRMLTLRIIAKHAPPAPDIKRVFLTEEQTVRRDWETIQRYRGMLDKVKDAMQDYN